MRVRAVSVNARDWHVMRGDPYSGPAGGARTCPGAPARGPRSGAATSRPWSSAVGADVTGFNPGDEVYGDVGTERPFAEYVAAPGRPARRDAGQR